MTLENEKIIIWELVYCQVVGNNEKENRKITSEAYIMRNIE